MSKTVDLTGFLRLTGSAREVEHDMMLALAPFAEKLAAIRAEQDKLATAIGEVHGPGTYVMPGGRKYKVRAYRKDDKQGRSGYYFLDFEEKDKGVTDLSQG